MHSKDPVTVKIIRSLLERYADYCCHCRAKFKRASGSDKWGGREGALPQRNKDRRNRISNRNTTRRFRRRSLLATCYDDWLKISQLEFEPHISIRSVL